MEPDSKMYFLKVLLFLTSISGRLFYPHDLLQLPLFSQVCKFDGDKKQGETLTANNLISSLVGNHSFGESSINEVAIPFNSFSPSLTLP